MKISFVFATLLSFAALAACSPSPEASGDPADAKIITEDLDRFWLAWDAAAPLQDKAERVRVFDELYLGAATPGLEDFIESRISSAEKLVETIDANPQYYASLRDLTPKAAAASEPVRAAFEELESMYPDAIFPDVYILMGRMNSGGTVGKAGLLIGFEMHGMQPHTPTDELGDWEKSVMQPVEAMPHIIAHELIHYQQEWLSGMPPLLVQVFREGSADFVTELISGRHINHHVHDWALPREAGIWEHFSARMHDTDSAGYLYGGERPDGWPQDVGYFVGYRIAQAYYEQAENKQQALADILKSPDVEALLAKSGYAKRFEKIGGQFTLSRLDEDSWRTQYCFPREVDAIRFERPFPGLRENSWSIADSAFELTFSEDQAELRRHDGAPFKCASVNLETYKERPEKDYYAFSPFSDGGVSVYTGHLMGPVLIDGEWRQTELAAEFVGREGERVITREPEKLAHQFVYFGKQDVLETDGVIAVIDPAMPKLARQNILDGVPAVNALLKQEFNFEPAEPYLLFMATELDAFDGHSVKGGVQPGQVLFSLKGRGVTDLLEKNPTHFSKGTAHEVLHLWQVEHWFNTMGNDHPWMHEGSADALAIEIMRLTNIYDAARYEDTWASVERECVDALAETSVHAAPENGRFDVVYACGALVNRLVAETINPENPGDGLIAFWQAMAAWPEVERKMPSEKLFFQTLEKLGFSFEQRNELAAFLELQTDDGAAAVQLLRRTLAQPRTCPEGDAPGWCDNELFRDPPEDQNVSELE